ncbi:hypothetical protein LCGC14_0885610 [marine sediment metagenome]|uniref:Uncharacterized protein n=1 Tax=marine sediment metagenome TaxID=412755 RepID=A0A0F9P5M9_9ZZZZ
MTNKKKLKKKIKRLEKAVGILKKSIKTVQMNYAGLSYILFSIISTYDRNSVTIQKTFEEISKIFNIKDNGEEVNETDKADSDLEE